MFRKLFCFTFLLATIASQAQNLQLNYDMRNSLYGDKHFPNNYFTATFEIFKADKWGSTFMFIDADFNLSKANIGMMYTEIARDFQINNFPLRPHIEFNGGLGVFEIDAAAVGGYRIPNAYLLGMSYPFQLGNAFMSTYVAYKYHAFKQTSHDVQWTLTWSADYFNHKLTLTGFTDVWTENKNPYDADSEKKIVLLTEPQIWYNVNKNLSLGGEVEISSNFAGSHRAYVCPTLGVKWNF